MKTSDLKRQQIKEWKLRNPEKQKQYDKRYREKNLEAIRAKNKALDRQRGYSKRRYQNNREECISKNAAYRKTPMGIAVVHNSNARRRARINGCKNAARSAEISTLLLSASECHYCHIKFSDAVRKTIDHVIPLCRGGLHVIANMVVSCGPCNFSKSGK